MNANLKKIFKLEGGGGDGNCKPSSVKVEFDIVY